MVWSRDEVLAAVRDMLSSSSPRAAWTFERADLDGDRVLVVFRVPEENRFGLSFTLADVPKETRFGVHYALADVPEGVNTGMVCETPRDWAFEIVLDMDEQIETGGMARAKRLTGPNGLVLLRWVW